MKNFRMMTRKLFGVILFLALLAGSIFSAPIFAAPPDSKTVRLGCFESTGMFEGARDGARKRGYSYEYMMQAAVYTGWKYEYCYGSFAELYEKLKKGEIDILPYTNYNEQRGQEVLFSDSAMVEEEYYLVARPESKVNAALGVSSLNGKVIATVAGADFNSLLTDYLGKNGVAAEVKYYPTVSECWMAARSGEADATVFTSIAYSNDKWDSICSFGRKPTFVAVAKGRPELLARLNEATELMQKESPALLGELYEEYFSGNPMRRSVTPEERAWLLKHPVLRVGGFANDAPYSFGKDSKTGQITGLSPEVVKDIIERLNLSIKTDFKCYKSLAEMEAALDAGELDVIIPFYSDHFVAREHNLIISNPVRVSNMELVYKKGTPVAEAVRKIATPDTKLGIFYVREHYPDSEIAGAVSIQDAVDKVQSGEAAGAIAQNIALHNIKEKYDNLNYIVLPEGCVTCFAARPENYPLIRVLNRGLMYFSHAEIASMASRYTPEPNVTLSAFVASHKGMTALLFFVMIVALYYVLIKQQRIREEKRAHQALVENNLRVLALEDDFEALYDVEIDSGRYEVFVKDETFNKEIQAKLSRENDYFTDLRANIAAAIYPDDREALYNVLNREALRRGLAENAHIDHYYRAIVGNAPAWFKIRAVYKDDAKKNVIIGAFNAAEEVAAKEMADKTRNDMIAKMATGVSLYIVNPQTERFRILSQDEHLAANYPADETYTESITRYIAADVFEPDREMATEALSLSTIAEYLKHNRKYVTRYRDISSGKPQWYEMRAVKLSDTEIIYNFTNRNREIYINGYGEKIIADQFAIFSIDLDNETLTVLKKSPWDSAYEEGDCLPYSQVIKRIGEMSKGNIREVFLRLSDIGYVRQIFAKDDKHILSYHSSFVDGEKWVMAAAIVVARHDDGSPASFVLGFSLLDTIGADKAEMQTQLEESLAAVQAEKKRYDVVHEIVNSGQWSFEVSADDEVISSNYSEMMETIINNDLKPLPGFWRTLVHPDDLAEAGAAFDAAVRDHSGQTPFDVNFRMRDRNGNYNWFRSAGRVVRQPDGSGEFFGIHVNINKRIEEEKQRLLAEKTEIQLKHEQLRSEVLNFMMDNDDDPIELLKNFAEQLRVLISCDQVIYRDLEETRIMVNSPAIEKTWSVPIEYCQQCQHFDAHHPMYKDGYTEMANCQEGWQGIPVYEKCPIKSSLTRIVYCDNEVAGYLAIHYVQGYHQFTDTERSTVEEFTRILSISLSRYAARKENKELKLIAEMQEQLKEALEKAETANKSKSSFLFSMSHDIRTPMNAITGFTAMAKKYLNDREKVGDYLNKIDVSGKQLLSLVNQVLEMSRIESGKIELDPQPVNIRERFDTMVTILGEQAEVSGLMLNYELKDIRHLNVLADDSRMSQITLNIAGNAMKFTPEGGKIEFRLQEKPCDKTGFARYTFIVADNGIGMSKEFQKVMYDPFAREKTSTISHIQGTGLGLPIVKKLVDLMGGTIEVDSAPGRGTRFEITIDFKIDEAAENTAAVTEETGSSESFAGKRVLLVEDNELNREIAKDILEEFELLVEEADDGDVAVEMVKAAFDRGEHGYYDLVLMDIQMPKLNGYEATRAIRKLLVPDGFHLPIVAMTANAFEEDRRNAFAAGMDEHLAKPIEIDKLLETLARFL